MPEALRMGTCHVHALAMALAVPQDSIPSVETHLLHIFENSQNVSGLAAVFFLHTRCVVADLGHTPGQHAQ